MNAMNGRLMGGLVLGMIAGLALAAGFHRADAAPQDATAGRLQRLEDREQILELMAAYGATLDRRDFAAFAQLFAEDAAYGGGASTTLTRGRNEIAAMLEKAITSNTANLPGPNSHLFFNPSIQVDGDRATARSKGAYTVPDKATRSTQLIFFITYEDTFVRRDGRWLFQQRLLKS